MKDIVLGALLRVYSSNRDMSHTDVFNFGQAVRELLRLGVTDIQVEVWAEKDNPQADCGTTADILRHELDQYPEVHVHNATVGDLFVGILNYGIRAQYARGVTHTLILSYQAFTYLDEQLFAEMRREIGRGAAVVTVALAEIKELVEQGMVCNSCALWDLEKLLTIGGFHARDTKPKGDPNHYADSPAGVGEILPLLALRQLLGRPMHAVLYPHTEGSYEVSAEKRAINAAKFASKERRLHQMLALAGYTMDDLHATLMRAFVQFNPGQVI